MQNVWQEQYVALQNMEQIELDVQRLEDDEEPARPALVQLLYIWSCVNPDLGYRQGMHEIASFVWQIRQQDGQEALRALAVAGTYPPKEEESWLRQRFPQTLSNESLALLFAEDDIEADTFYLTSSILHRLRPYFSAERSGSPALLKAILHRVDPQLAQHLLALQMEWQPILMRWQRLLYLHEFTRADALLLWDTWFYADPKLELMQYVSAAMVLRLRDQLMESDFPGAMTMLMHFADTHVSSKHLVDDGEALRTRPRPETGAAIAAATRTAPTPDPGLVAKAREHLYEITGQGAQRLAQEIAHLAPFHKRASNTPVWSPKTEDRLRSDPRDKDTQRRRAMLSLDNA